MLMDAGLDTGPVYVSESLSIGARETAGELHDRLASLGANLLGKYLDTILVDELQPTAQPEDGVTYARLINKTDGVIDWTQPAMCIDRQIRAYTPWPVAHTLYKGEPLRCLAGAALDADGACEPGTLIGLEDDGLWVQTSEGVLVLTRPQLAGRKPVSALEFANAHTVDDVILGQ
jgi:methionyl-tRNA formyltransferase